MRGHRCIQQLAGCALLEMARQVPPKPDLGQNLAWDWHPSEDPTVPLLGPWSEPTSLRHAVAELERLQSVSRGRQAVLAMAWADIHHRALWKTLGFATATAFVEQVFGVTPRTAARWRQAGWGMQQHPELREAVREGLDLDRAAWVGMASPERSNGAAKAWIAVAERVGRQELERLEPELHRHPSQVRRRYQLALELADQWSAAHDQTSVGARSNRPSRRLRVSLPVPDTELDDPRPLRVPPGLVQACRWLLQHVRLPSPGRYNQVKHRDAFTCQNPECGHRSLRVHKHHIIERQHGGTDDPHNLVTLCVSCHLRGVHTGRISLKHVEVFGHAALLWRFPDGRRVLAFRDPLHPGGVHR